LFLVVQPNGGKLWRLRYFFRGKERSLSIDPFLKVSIAEARARRQQAKEQIASGIDPSVQKKLDRIAVETADVAVPPIADAPRWIEPDALFAIGERVFALEADMGAESIEAIIKPKIRAYRQIVATGTIDDHFGVDNLAVLFVTTNEKRMRNMMKAVESIARNGRSAMFGFACRRDLGQFTHAGSGRTNVPGAVAQGRA
jgi:hypothetical protein